MKPITKVRFRRRSGVRASRLLAATASVAGVLALLLPAASPAAITAVGSPLATPATLNTSANLPYQGVNTPVPPNPEAPNGLFHTPHFGADTAIWNVASSGGAAMPASGEVVEVKLEGCAQPALGGPAPLTQMHFQDLSPLPGGGARVNLTSAPFDIPVCGSAGASGSTVTGYRPFNLCVSKGDYVAFNDEGGYVPFIYRAGVPYQVLAPASGATVDSFIRGEGTKNGAILAAGDKTAMDGFAAATGEELMLQVELGTGPDARYVCPGGTRDAPPTLAPIHIRAQSDGVNAQQIVNVAIYCRPAAGCAGTAILTLPATGRSAAKAVGHFSFNVPGNSTGHVPVKVSSALMSLVRRHHVTTVCSAVVAGQTFSGNVTVGIF